MPRRRRVRAPLALVIVAALASTSIGGAQTPPPPSVAVALQNIEATYHALEHEMWFTRTSSLRGNIKATTSQGTLTFAKPDSARLRFSNGDYVVIGGSTMGQYSSSARVFTLQPTKLTSYLAILAFMSGPGALAAQCSFTIYPGAQLQFPNGYVMICDPVVASPTFSKILYYVDAGTSEVRRVLVLDSLGNRDRFDFDLIQSHATRSPQLFSLTPPSGATLIANGSVVPAPTPQHAASAGSARP